MSGLKDSALALCDWIEGHLERDPDDHSGVLALVAEVRGFAAHTGPRKLAGGVEYLGATELTPDIDRWRALLRARAEETGFEHAIIDIERDGQNKSHPRFTLCWPTGDEHALSDLVVEVFAHTLALVQQGTQGGAGRIAAERRRQVDSEGWTPEHDNEHDRGQLACAAACYAASAVNGQNACDRNGNDLWPWAREWDKRPSPGVAFAARIRALEKAGALCAAEIDRLLRLEGAPTAPGATT